MYSRVWPLASILTLATLIATSAPAFSSRLHGKWSNLGNWPIIPLHAVMLRDGRVMSFGTDLAGSQTSTMHYDLWRPALGLQAAAHSVMPNPTLTDIFCAGIVSLPRSGNVLTVGGDDGILDTNNANNEVTVFQPALNTLSRGPSMIHKRWYATAIVLPDERILVQGGRKDAVTGAGVTTPEILIPDYAGQNGIWAPLSGATNAFAYNKLNERWFYPRSWVAPNGKVFVATTDAHFWIDPAGTGNLYNAALLPLAHRHDRASSTAVMYGRGKIMRTGGGNGEVASRKVLLIDINGPTAKFSAAPNIRSSRHWLDATLLPDGQVLLNGGSEINQKINQGTVAYRPEMWDPARLSSRLLEAPESRARLYHATSLLLPGGRVLSGGGGTPGPQKNLNAQVYSPGYLFRATGELAARPKITSVPKVLPYDSDIAIDIDRAGAGSIRRVTMVKLGAVTHSFNAEQRFIEVAFTRQGNTMTIRTPANNRLATPGSYYLFLIGQNGQPSPARIVRLSRQKAKNPARARNLITDSGFEAVVRVGAVQPVILPKGGYFGGWEVIAKTATIISNAHQDLGRPTDGPKPDGRQHLELSGTTPSGVRQLVSGLRVGETYQLDLFVAKRPGTPIGEGRVQIGSIDQYLGAFTNGNERWTKLTYRFVANKQVLPLILRGGGAAGCCGLLVDRVTLKHIP